MGSVSERVRRRARAELHRVGAVCAAPLSRVNPEPRFVLGNQRSGTTAIAALLADVTGASAELDLTREVFSPTFDLLRSGEMTIDGHVRRNRASYSRTIIKEPHLTPFLDELRAYFPAARFALVVRDPRDNIRSLYDYLEIPGDQADPQLTRSRRVARWKSWRMVVDGGWLDLDGRKGLEHLAHRWNLCADVYLDNRDRVVLVRYEDFVRDRLGLVRSLGRSLDLGPGSAHVTADDAVRPFQPRGSHRDDSPEAFFGPANLEAIERICGERMSALGYEPATL